jgi:hypothetical protein
MPTSAQFRAAVALGLAVVFGSMAGLTIMAGAMAQSAVNGKKWSEEMTAITTSGSSLMMTLGIVMIVLAVIAGGLGVMFNRSGSRA